MAPSSVIKNVNSLVSQVSQVCRLPACKSQVFWQFKYIALGTKQFILEFLKYAITTCNYMIRH